MRPRTAAGAPVERRGPDRPWATSGSRDDELERLRQMVVDYQALVADLTAQLTVLRVERDQAVNLNAAAAEFRLAAARLGNLAV